MTDDREDRFTDRDAAAWKFDPAMEGAAGAFASLDDVDRALAAGAADDPDDPGAGADPREESPA